jgi:hypothetical protein
LVAALFFVFALTAPAPAPAQTTNAAPAAPAEAPDRFEAARLVWSTLIAIDHANRTGNYTVLRDLGAPSFRRANDPARLAQIFAKVRRDNLGIGRVVLSAPVYDEPPRILDNGLYQVKGVFPGRPNGVAFELLFQDVKGEWRLFGVWVAKAPPAPPPAPSARPAAPKE